MQSLSRNEGPFNGMQMSPLNMFLLYLMFTGKSNILNQINRVQDLIGRETQHMNIPLFYGL